MDLTAIIIHTIAWSCFGYNGGPLNIAASVFSFLESVMIIGGYLNVWYNPRIENMAFYDGIFGEFANDNYIVCIYIYYRGCIAGVILFCNLEGSFDFSDFKSFFCLYPTKICYIINRWRGPRGYKFRW